MSPYARTRDEILAWPAEERAKLRNWLVDLLDHPPERLLSMRSAEGFFAEIHVTDPAFARPEQGQLPSAPELGP